MARVLTAQADDFPKWYQDVVAKAEELLAEGAKISEVAGKLNVKKNTLQKAVRAGRVREPVKKNNSMHTFMQMA